MKTSQIQALLNKKISIENFKEIISIEVQKYSNKSQSTGGSNPIYLEEDLSVKIGPKEGIFLLEAYVNNKLTKYEISYIADALLLSGHVQFESEVFLDNFETLTDPEINGPFTNEDAKQMISLFKSME